ncbi:glycosyltransferase [Fusobacterium mortiferum]|uniref:glycosyltransferase n=1 Tax=Fusobacterium mortiferum TaxID=850 RepID=UPI0019578FCD|nr:glycosyltransferase [Fusobacterium mortiferum]
MKKILFVIDSLACAGAEKSLITLLSLIDYSKYEVDLQLFSYGGELENLLPKEVKLLEPFNYMKFTTLSLKKAIQEGIFKLKLKYLFSRLKFSFILRKGKYDNKAKARLFWEINKNCIEETKKEYDIAIAYAQGVPTFYVADRVKAKKKIAWINTSYHLERIEKQYQRNKYRKFNKIVLVSNSAKNIFKEVYPEFEEKLEIIYDINNPKIMEEMSNIGEKLPIGNEIKILTIGRFAKGKAYDIALEACKILKDKGIKFKWYILGKGPLKEEIEQKIDELGLKEHFILLGVTPNPYGYIKSADIYVQTSRFEGFGLAIAEARILNVPVVTTEFDAVYNQMVQRKNGIVTQMDAQSVADGIMELIENKELKNSIIEYLKKEKKGNLEEYKKFEKLVEG